jgi:REP element-mobilizing transposase RayT
MGESRTVLGWASRGWHSRGYLPHCDGRSLVQHVTVHLGDSLPRAVIERIERSLARLGEDQRNVERRKRLHEWIDAGHGRCVLREPPIAEMVQNTFLHFAGDRYQLHAWVVMPNHIHVLFEPLAGWALAKIVASWKKFTARKIRDFLRTADGGANREIGVPGNADLPIGLQESGPVWHSEYWDRYIRNERHEQTGVVGRTRQKTT